VTGVLNATRYRNIEILIIDNGSVEGETLIISPAYRAIRVCG
jgi:glycosyltransferase involved in cell wall biosynthesis